MKVIARAMVVVCAALAAPGAASQEYPARPIRMIVPFVPGGSSDFVARIIQPKMMELLGQTVVVDNRAGASGNVGVGIAAQSVPDGYTIFLGNVGSTAINPSIFPEFPYRAVRYLVGITLLVDVPGAFAVHPSVPAKSVK